MDNSENSTEDAHILKQFGGTTKNDLKHLIGEYTNTSEIPTVANSHYISPEHLPVYAQNYNKNFSVLSLNICSIVSNGKFDIIKSLLDDLQDKGITFSAICFQETWLQGSSPDVSLFSLPGYTCVPLGATCSSHGGLIMYIQDKFKYTVHDYYEPSDIWEGQFVEIHDGGLLRPVTVCNIYKPPRDNNSNRNISAFLDKLSPIIHSLTKHNTETIIVGDMNIDLLKINDRTKYQEYFDLLINNSFIPQINLPTRFGRKNATLIDHIFCKMTTKSTTQHLLSGILMTMASDHQATFVFTEHQSTKEHPPKYVYVQTNDAKAIQNFCNELNNLNLVDKLNKDQDANPDINYNILENALLDSKEKHLPIKQRKFNRYKHVEQRDLFAKQKRIV